MEFDLGNLLAYDPQPVDANTFKNGVGETCLDVATKVTQALVKRLFSLPSTPAPVGRIAMLPPPVTVLPREKPIPKPRPPTKWEIFAQRKGIQKTKRSKLEWDETAGEWRRRHGYKRVNDESEIPVIEARPDEETGTEDPFTRMRREKKERTKKQEASQLANLKAAAKAGGKAALPATLKLAAVLPDHGRGQPTKRKELKGEIKNTVRQVATSTASLGKFDRRVAGEDMKDRQHGAGKKRKFMSLTSTKEEREAQGKLVDHILRKNADDIVDIGRAIGRLESDARDERRQYRAKNKGDNKKKKQPRSVGPNKGGATKRKGGKK